MSRQRGGPPEFWRRGAPCYGTNGTMVNSALGRCECDLVFKLFKNRHRLRTEFCGLWFLSFFRPWIIGFARTCIVNMHDLCLPCSFKKLSPWSSGAPDGRGPQFIEPAEPAIATPLPWPSQWWRSRHCPSSNDLSNSKWRTLNRK